MNSSFSGFSPPKTTHAKPNPEPAEPYKFLSSRLPCLRKALCARRGAKKGSCGGNWASGLCMIIPSSGGCVPIGAVDHRILDSSPQNGTHINILNSFSYKYPFQLTLSPINPEYVGPYLRSYREIRGKLYLALKGVPSRSGSRKA